MGGGSDLKLLTPDPEDPVDPLDPVDPRMSSKSGVFVLRVVILGLGGALA